MKKNIIILIIAIIVAAGAGFFGGMQYQKMAGAKIAINQAANRGNFTGARAGARTGANGAGFTSGQILSKTDNSLTIKLTAGGSEIVFLAPSSQIMRSSTTTIANLNIGDNVMITGTANSDGTITARTIQTGDFRFNGNRPAEGQGSQTPAQGQ